MEAEKEVLPDHNIGKIHPRILEQEMQESYLDYAMSVIVARALPDVRDGLKPVHRRVLFAMNEAGLRHTAKFRKSATVVGDVLGHYHPHGDMAVYDTLVRLAQNFAMRYPLVQGQGNFGCFTKDTKVKLTDGRDLSFGDLVEEHKRGKINYAYTVNNLGLISIAEIKKPRLTIRQTELVKVILDNGEEIRCTPNHLFMLKEGTYKEAQFLVSGESLMPLYQKISEKTDRLNREGYVLIYQNKKDEWVPSHHLADNHNLTNWKYKKSAGRVRHHIDFNRFNNNPDNIKRMQWGEHWEIHYQNASFLHQREDYRQKIAEGRRIYWDNQANREKYSQRLSERNLQNWQDETYREKMRVILSEVNKKYIQEHPERRKKFSTLATKTLKRLWQNQEYRAFMREKIIEGNKNHITNKTGKVKFLKVCQELLNKKIIIDEENYNEFRNLVYPYGHATSWQTGLSEYFQNNSELIYQEINKNHKVVKVEKLSYLEDVYDLSIDRSHNFCLAAGVFVHNSVDGDSAAAPRYTEARMAAISEELLSDIDKNTVDFMDNYDGTRKEPKVLPAKVPQLLLNGTMGIAVGMATSIPPHNLKELSDAVVAVIDNSKIDVDELIQYLPGPDFPTGGVIYNPEEIKEAYVTGKGRVVIRAVAEIEEGKRGGYRIIISEIPYQVNKSELVTKIADLVKTKKIIGVSDLRDESDKEGIRVVIDLKADAYPKKILNQLYKLTAMQTAFHINMLALVDGLQPKVLDLKSILEYFIAHRQEVVTRRTQFDLVKAQERAHILEGLKIALDNLDAVIQTIRKSDTKEEAHANLIKKFKLSDTQAQAILEMRLQALAGLERKKVENEYKEKQTLIKELKSILADPQKILDIIKQESLDLKARYGDARRTQIVNQTLGKFSEKDLVPNEEVIITLTKGGYIKRQPVALYHSQHRGGKGIIGMTTKEEDQIEIIQSTKNHDDILFFTNRGRVFRQKVYEVPQSSRIAKGTAIVNVIQLAPEEIVTTILTIASYKPGDNLVMITRRGVIKKTEAEKYANIRANGLIAIKLDAGDELKWVRKSRRQDSVIIITQEGQSIHFEEKDARLLGRSTRGVRGIKLRPNDEVVSADVAHSGGDYAYLVIAEKGLGKRTNLNQYSLQRRGGIGVKTMHVTDRTGKIIGGKLVDRASSADLIITSKNGQVIRTLLASVPLLGRVTQGVTLMRLKSGDKIASFSIIAKDGGEEEPEKSSLIPKKNGGGDVQKPKEETETRKSTANGKSKTFLKRKIVTVGLRERTSKLAKKGQGFIKKKISLSSEGSATISRLSKKRKR